MRTSRLALAIGLRAYFSWSGVWTATVDLKQSTTIASRQIDLTSTAQTQVIDAGIVIANEANFLCVPLSRIGLVDADVVKSMTSSCECVRPSFITFADTAEPLEKGSELTFFPIQTRVHLSLPSNCP